MRVHTIIHASFEEPGVIKDWAHNNHYNYSCTHTYQGEELPDISAIDFLIILGGPQSLIEIDNYPYLLDEVNLIKQAIAQNKAVLGICLGAQLIGESLGARTEKSPHKEIGIFPIELNSAGEKDPILCLLPKKFNVLHWHSDMPGMTRRSVLLASSAGCPRQAIRYGDRVYGLQFHMEMTPQLIKNLVSHCEDDIISGKYIQAKEQLLSADLKEMNAKLMQILDHLAKDYWSI